MNSKWKQNQPIFCECLWIMRFPTTKSVTMVFLHCLSVARVKVTEGAQNQAGQAVIRQASYPILVNSSLIETLFTNKTYISNHKYIHKWHKINKNFIKGQFVENSMQEICIFSSFGTGWHTHMQTGQPAWLRCKLFGIVPESHTNITWEQFGDGWWLLFKCFYWKLHLVWIYGFLVRFQLLRSRTIYMIAFIAICSFSGFRR